MLARNESKVEDLDRDPVLEVNQLTVNYDKTPVLWDLSFTIPKGVLVGIIRS